MTKNATSSVERYSQSHWKLLQFHNFENCRISRKVHINRASTETESTQQKDKRLSPDRKNICIIRLLIMREKSITESNRCGLKTFIRTRPEYKSDWTVWHPGGFVILRQTGTEVLLFIRNICFTSFDDNRHIRQSPFNQMIQIRDETTSAFGQTIFHPGRNLRKYFTAYQSVRLQHS